MAKRRQRAEQCIVFCVGRQNKHRTGVAGYACTKRITRMHAPNASHELRTAAAPSKNAAGRRLGKAPAARHSQARSHCESSLTHLRQWRTRGKIMAPGRSSNIKYLVLLVPHRWGCCRHKNHHACISHRVAKSSKEATCQALSTQGLHKSQPSHATRKRVHTAGTHPNKTNSCVLTVCATTTMPGQCLGASSCQLHP